jgi:predicted NAD/FAD-binding protein
MPKRRTAWAAYNYMTLPSQKLDEDEERISVTCWMNCLQGLSIETYGPIFVTVNPLRQPMGEQGRWMYKHPVYTANCIKGQQRLSSIQNKRSISYAGAWTKFGFREDGFSSGLRAAKHIEPTLPIEIIDSILSRGQPPARGIVDHFLRTSIRFVQSVLNIWHATIVQVDHSKASVQMFEERIRDLKRDAR